MHRLYAVTVMGEPRTLQIDEALNRAVKGEWIRLAANSWFVWTEKNKVELASVVLACQGHDGMVVVTAVHPEQAVGKTFPWVWDWLNTRMTRQFQGLD